MDLPEIKDRLVLLQDRIAMLEAFHGGGPTAQSQILLDMVKIIEAIAEELGTKASQH